MDQTGVVVGNFALSFSLNFWSIFVHISGSSTLILAWLERSFPLAEVEYRWCQILVNWWRQKWKKGQDSSRLVTGGTGVNGLTDVFQMVKVTVDYQYSVCFVQQVRAAFEILTLLFAFLYIVILIRQMIFQEKLKTVLFDLVRLLCLRVFNKYSLWYCQTLREKEVVNLLPC